MFIVLVVEICYLIYFLVVALFVGVVCGFDLCDAYGLWGFVFYTFPLGLEFWF